MYECKIAEKLTELRKAKGLKQEDVAKALSVSDKTISKWENGASSPDFSMLIELSKYYNVSTDSLLGIAQEEKKNTASVIRSEFEGVNYRNTVLKAFEIVREIIPASFYNISNYKEEIKDEVNFLPEKKDQMNHYRISTSDIYQFVTNSDDVNMAVILMKNKSDFSWLKDSDKQKKIAKLFTFLSDTDALAVCGFIHSSNCSESFTADYIAKNTCISEDMAVQILEDFCEICLCSKVNAHLISGEISIYESRGNGNILSLITLAYEYMCGDQGYNYNFNGKCKMIGGK